MIYPDKFILEIKARDTDMDEFIDLLLKTLPDAPNVETIKNQITDGVYKIGPYYRDIAMSKKDKIENIAHNALGLTDIVVSVESI